MLPVYTETEKAILRTISFLDLFEYPLTPIQCWRLAYSLEGGEPPFDLAETEQALVNLLKQGIVKQQNNFWQLANSPDYYEIRQERYRLAAAKFKKINFWMKIFRLLPWVRMIAVVNPLGYRNAELGDDVDLLIITKQKRLWLTRFYITGLAKVFGLRPTPQEKQDKLCLNFYLSDKHLNLNDVLLDNKDVRFHFYFTQFSIIFNDGVLQDYLRDNSDILDHFPNFNLQVIGWSTTSRLLKIARFFFSLFTWLPGESFCRYLQKKIMPQNLRKLANVDTRVIISDEILKFHNQDKRFVYRDTWYKKLAELRIV